MAKRVSTSKTKCAKTSGSRLSQEKKGNKAETSQTTSADLRVGDEEVTIDRRGGDRRQRAPEDGAAQVNHSVAPKLERRKKVSRRRQIDPTTCERDYSEQEVEFMNALEKYKRQSGRMFPTCSEVLEVIRGLDYVQLTATEAVARQEGTPAVESPKDLEGFPQQEETNLEELLTTGIENDL